ncbi:MAG: F0F1 ATP synthase subunit A [Actinomycetota bacterium]|jgi:F-type H+-transporting ATPase subunit a|nr:F0F1 ATP synthase subunit A [Actinomycetota bacterium]
MELLPVKIEHLVHELSVLPFNDMNGTVVGPFVLTNYTFWGLIALTTAVIMFTVAARRITLMPGGRFTGAIEAGVEFIRDMATDVIGEEDGKKYVPLLGAMFFLILVSNMFGLIPGGKSIGGSIGATTALALITWVVFVWVGFAKNGFVGYFKSLIPSGVREMPLAGRLVLGGYIFLLEFISTFLIRPLTLAVRLFANMYAGHIILGVFSAFVFLFFPFFQEQLSFSVGGGLVGIVAFVFLVLMYAFEVFVAFIQAYVFTILTAVYIQSSVHAGDH